MFSVRPVQMKLCARARVFVCVRLLVCVSAYVFSHSLCCGACYVLSVSWLRVLVSSSCAFVLVVHSYVILSCYYAFVLLSCFFVSLRV